MKFSLIFPLPSSSDWKKGLTKKQVNKIIKDWNDFANGQKHGLETLDVLNDNDRKLR
jgi:hypothetical protein